jgi:hypothetical protein
MTRVRLFSCYCRIGVEFRLASPPFYTMTFEEVENLCQPFLDVPSINWIGSLEAAVT